MRSLQRLCMGLLAGGLAAGALFGGLRWARARKLRFAARAPGPVVHMAELDRDGKIRHAFSAFGAHSCAPKVLDPKGEAEVFRCTLGLYSYEAFMEAAGYANASIFCWILQGGSTRKTVVCYYLFPKTLSGPDVLAAIAMGDKHLRRHFEHGAFEGKPSDYPPVASGDDVQRIRVLYEQNEALLEKPVLREVSLGEAAMEWYGFFENGDFAVGSQEMLVRCGRRDLVASIHRAMQGILADLARRGHRDVGRLPGPLEDGMAPGP